MADDFQTAVVASLATIEANQFAVKTDIADIKAILNGNNGLVARVAGIEGRMSVTKSMAASAGGGGIASVLILFLIDLGKKHFGLGG